MLGQARGVGAGAPGQGRGPRPAGGARGAGDGTRAAHHRRSRPWRPRPARRRTPRTPAAKEIVGEARALRERVLADLNERRQELERQIAELRAGTRQVGRDVRARRARAHARGTRDGGGAVDASRRSRGRRRREPGPTTPRAATDERSQRSRPAPEPAPEPVPEPAPEPAPRAVRPTSGRPRPTADDAADRRAGRRACARRRRAVREAAFGPVRRRTRDRSGFGRPHGRRPRRRRGEPTARPSAEPDADASERVGADDRRARHRGPRRRARRHDRRPRAPRASARSRTSRTTFSTACAASGARSTPRRSSRRSRTSWRAGPTCSSLRSTAPTRRAPPRWARGRRPTGGAAPRALLAELVDLGRHAAPRAAGELARRPSTTRTPADTEIAIAQSLGARYREWRAQQLEAVLGDVLAVAYARGVFDAAPDGAPPALGAGGRREVPRLRRQRARAHGEGAASSPPVRPHPPAHPGCRCLLVVEPPDTRCHTSVPGPPLPLGCGPMRVPTARAPASGSASAAGSSGRSSS